MPESPDFRALFESAPGLYLVLDTNLSILAVTEAYLRATMTKRELILGRGIFDVFPDNPDDLEATGVRNLRTSLETVLRTGQPDTMVVQKYDVRRPEAEGGGFDERYWSPRNSPVLGPRGETRYIIHRVEDVTDFVRLKQVGHERDMLTRALQDRAVRMESEIYLRAQDVAEANLRLKTANAALGGLYTQISLLLPHADEVDLLRNPISPEEMLVRVSRMITDHERMEEQLRQSQKMEAVGRLAGGVAHDFNNLLTVIAGYAALLKDELTHGGEQPELDEIQHAVGRAAELTTQLLAFSRKQVLQPRVLEFNGVVRRMEGMLRRLIGENIVLTTLLAPDLGKVKADPGQLEQVIMNLAVNARDAMRHGGKLIIETRNVTLEEGQVSGLPAGHHVLLSVRDTGQGMSAETISRIFEPFFTTKEAGKGTGLGLATALGIVEQSGGTLRVSSQVGEGSTFLVYLPWTQDQAVEDESASVPPRTGSTATVLLVEDEAPLRKLVVLILTGAGHQVLEAASGDEALALSSRKMRPVDLLLTDVMMPGMSGPELVANLRHGLPDLKVLYMSGYDYELIDQNSLAAAAGFLPKPFSPRTLLERVDAILGVRGQDQSP